MRRTLKEFSKKVALTDGAHYSREAYQSYMTSPEWLSVDISEDFANFLGAGHSMFHFPYFYKIYQLWRVFFLALGASIRESGFFNTVFSDYMVMDMFVVVFTSFELLPKALVSLLLWPFLPKENPTDFQYDLAEYFEDFVCEIEGTPFFNHDYDLAIQNIKNEWSQPVERTTVDWFTCTAVLMELRFKGFIASFLKNSDENEPHTTQALVKCHVGVDDAASPEEAILQFKMRLGAVYPHTFRSTLVTSHGQENVYVKKAPKEKDGSTYYSVYARLDIPRYMDCEGAVTRLERQGIHLREIAGHDHVMLKCKVDNFDSAVEARFNAMDKIKPLYRYEDGITPGRSMCFFKVPVNALNETINTLNCDDEISVKFVHNF
jgi:hypothetical protein